MLLTVAFVDDDGGHINQRDLLPFQLVGGAGGSHEPGPVSGSEIDDDIVGADRRLRTIVSVGCNPGADDCVDLTGGTTT